MFSLPSTTPLLRLVSLGTVAFVFAALFARIIACRHPTRAAVVSPTSIMMVAFTAIPRAVWHGIAVACSLGSIGASLTLFPAASLSFSWTGNKYYRGGHRRDTAATAPQLQPLTNLNDWFRLRLSAAP